MCVRTFVITACVDVDECTTMNQHDCGQYVIIQSVVSCTCVTLGLSTTWKETASVSEKCWLCTPSPIHLVRYFSNSNALILLSVIRNTLLIQSCVERVCIHWINSRNVLLLSTRIIND